MRIFKDRYLIISIVVGIAVRLLLAPLPGFKFDVDTWFAWADRLNSVGFAQFYSNQIWTGYPPGFLYILAVLGFIKNVIHINSSQFYIILKLPSILSEIVLGLIIYRVILSKFINWRKIALIFVMLNPAFIFNSAIFGQFDGLFSLILILSVLLLNQGRIILSSIFLGLSFILKPQAILLLPIFFFYILKNFSFKKTLNITFPAISVTFLSFLPFFSTNPLKGPVNLFSNLFGYYPYNSIFAYNFWGIFGFWIPDNQTWGDINYQIWGYILFTLFWIIVSLFYLLKKKFFKNQLSVFSLSALSCLSFFFLPTRMHERYLYPSLVFLIIVAVLKKSRILIILTVILSLIHFLDLYYVYIYYNHFYLKLPAVLYNSFIYNFADKNIFLISLFSTIIFVLISINITMSNEYPKEN